MSRVSLFSSPFLLGFDAFEERLDRLAKSTEGYPPYNIERVVADDGSEDFVISIAVAGFSCEELEASVEDNQLLVRGRVADSPDREFLHRGIATRQFQRTFLLADGMEIVGAQLRDGLLTISLKRPAVTRAPRTIEIKTSA